MSSHTPRDQYGRVLRTVQDTEELLQQEGAYTRAANASLDTTTPRQGLRTSGTQGSIDSQGRERMVHGTGSDSRVFSCHICGFSSYYNYYGKNPPFCRDVVFFEKAYSLRDPFTAHSVPQPLQLGGDCALCKHPVCVDRTCSLFYSVRVCRDCALNEVNAFPPELQGELDAMRQQVPLQYPGRSDTNDRAT